MSGTKLEKAARQVIEAEQTGIISVWNISGQQAITALRKALAEPELNMASAWFKKCCQLQAELEAFKKSEQAEQEPLEDCYKVTYEDGTSSHFGNKRLAEINAGKGDKIEVVKLRALRLVEAAPQPVKQEPVHEALQIASVALQDIACSSQTENLYWWQLRARKAQKQIAERLINVAPVKQVDLTDGEIAKALGFNIMLVTTKELKDAHAVIAAYKEKNK